MRCCNAWSGLKKAGCSKLAVRFWKYESTRGVIRVVGYCKQHKEHRPGASWEEITEEEVVILEVMGS